MGIVMEMRIEDELCVICSWEEVCGLHFPPWSSIQSKDVNLLHNTVFFNTLSKSIQALVTLLFKQDFIHKINTIDIMHVNQPTATLGLQISSIDSFLFYLSFQSSEQLQIHTDWPFSLT